MSVAHVRMAAAGRRRQLLDTAVRLFSEGSYRGTTTAEIAKAAGISEPILYRHFASKRDLYLAAIDHVWEKAKAKWEEVLLGSPSVDAGLADIGQGHFSVRDCKFQLAELWVQALGEASEDPELRRHLRKHMREVHDFVADTIRRGQAEGSLHPDRDARVGAGGDGLLPARPRVLTDIFERREIEVALRGEVAVDDRLGDARGARDLGRRRAAVAPLDEDARGGLEQVRAAAGGRHAWCGGRAHAGISARCSRTTAGLVLTVTTATIAPAKMIAALTASAACMPFT